MKVVPGPSYLSSAVLYSMVWDFILFAKTGKINVLVPAGSDLLFFVTRNELFEQRIYRTMK